MVSFLESSPPMYVIPADNISSHKEADHRKERERWVAVLKPALEWRRRERQRERQTDRQTERDRQRLREKGEREKEKDRDREKERERARFKLV